jgi:type IV pilus assembly protein PilB
MAADWLQKLVDQGLISADQLSEAEEMAAGMGITIPEALVRQGYCSSSEIGRAQAAEFGYNFIELEGVEIPPGVIELVPESVARENVVIPVELDGDSLVVAVNDPMKLDVLDKLRFILNRDIDIVIAARESIQAHHDRHHAGHRRR